MVLWSLTFSPLLHGNNLTHPTTTQHGTYSPSESVCAINIAKIWNFRLRLRHWLNLRSIELIDGIEREISKQSHSFSSLIVSNSFALFSLFYSSTVLVFRWAFSDIKNLGTHGRSPVKCDRPSEQ